MEYFPTKPGFDISKFETCHHWTFAITLMTYEMGAMKGRNRCFDLEDVQMGPANISVNNQYTFTGIQKSHSN